MPEFYTGTEQSNKLSLVLQYFYIHSLVSLFLLPGCLHLTASGNSRLLTLNGDHGIPGLWVLSIVSPATARLLPSGPVSEGVLYTGL